MEAAHYEQDGLWGTESIFTPEHQFPKLDAVASLVPGDARTVVELGAGDGRVLHHLSTVRPNLTSIAVERSLAALGHVERPGVRASIDAIPVRSRSVDVALCCEVLEHLPGPIFDSARRELARIAGDWIVVTVPNRENRARADIRCEACGCRYNADRHLRSFAPDDLATLFDGFEVDEIIETGPHQPVYPRWARLALERRGLLVRPGSPSCPQCGAVYPYAVANHEIGPCEHGPGSPSLGARSYRLARRFLPKARHPYYLCARFRRR
ncbi:class I SAM-dependent methyltransferase [Rhabdothermincola sediminis]|uniref:class I SAM-dependent methyltransferase n=1 Tax=Rhabdothermincola sediminis TaxID=2751370 RepID=UPI001AA08663|nr:class I SAM-dependent methyltransferase [Rhabdothermincola sediminis]